MQNNDELGSDTNANNIKSKKSLANTESAAILKKSLHSSSSSSSNCTEASSVVVTTTNSFDSCNNPYHSNCRPSSSSSAASSICRVSTTIHQTTSESSQQDMKPNQVRSVLLNGTPIVALVIDGKERLCLAQISNTLLKTFSYNEIHNRRVALGITCVQCTPVQLEILRRAGAMPISSRRCGMISKREAERLCKSFLTENNPPKLPDNFSFDVTHECAWGCRGNFIPSRYNSSRAKCIKCSFCNMFFSPNKFIFHSHRLPDSKYVQPDAANFNSWRRHLKLSDDTVDDVVYAWEDVKAMFNGGSRKRVMAQTCSRFHQTKRPRPVVVDSSTAGNSTVCHTTIPSASTVMPVGLTSPPDARVPPYVSMLPTSYLSTNKTPAPYGLTTTTPPNAYLTRGSGGPMSCGFGATAAAGGGGGPAASAPPPPSPVATLPAPPTTCQTSGDKHQLACDLRGHAFVDYMWAASAKHHGPPLPTSTYGFIWPSRHHHHSSSPAMTTTVVPCEAKLSPGGSFYDERNYRDDTCSETSSKGNCDSELETQLARRSMSSCSEQDFRSSDNDDGPSSSQQQQHGFIVQSRQTSAGYLSSFNNHHHHHQTMQVQPMRSDKPIGYCSAFRPVVKRTCRGSGPSVHSVESLIRPTSPSTNTPDDTTYPCFDKVPPPQQQSTTATEDDVAKDSSNNSRKSADSDHVIDVEVTDDSKDVDDQVFEETKGRGDDDDDDDDDDEESIKDSDQDGDDVNTGEDNKAEEAVATTTNPMLWKTSQDTTTTSPQPAAAAAMATHGKSIVFDTSPTSVKFNQNEDASQKPSEIEALESASSQTLPFETVDKPETFTKEQLQEILLQETHARRRAEKEREAIKESLQEQVKREVAYREEITKQLEIVKETLCNELDQERKARFAVLQKLKEAHDALHHFSCKMILPRQCSECTYKPLLPQD